jgi:glycerol kinase
MDPLILSLDQGTTSTRAVAFALSPDGALTPVATRQLELTQHYPEPGWVEHDSAEIRDAALQTCREVVDAAGGVTRFAAMGITNQRETAVIWDAATGAPLHRAIVWQDRRTAETTRSLAADGHEPAVQGATGLILDPYFSASKFAWLLDAVPDGRARAARGEVRLGTVDAWLIDRLSGGRSHVTDATNAARTSLMDLRTLAWREDLAGLFAPAPGRWPRRRGRSSAAPCRSPGRPVTSRRRWSGTGRWHPATPRSPTAPGPSLWPMSGPRPWPPAPGCWPPSAMSSIAREPGRWRARSSRPARPSSGCATVSG